MGKKAKFKKLRKLAEQMPEIQTTVVMGEKVKGQVLLNEGHSQVQGKDIKASAVYIRQQGVQKMVNHNRQMKKLYNKYGPKGIDIYAQAVNRYVSSQETKKENPNPLKPTI